MFEEFKFFLINISQGGFIMVKSIIFPFFLARATFIILKEQSLVALKRLIFLVIIFFLLYYTSASLIEFVLELASELGSLGLETLGNTASGDFKSDEGITIFSGEILKRVVSAIISFIYIFLNLVSYMLATLVAIILPIGLALEICIGAGGPVLAAVSSFGTVFLYIVFFSSILDKIRVQGFAKVPTGGELTLFDLLTELVVVTIFIGSAIYMILKNREVSNYVNKPLNKVKDLAQESSSGVKRATSRSYSHVNDKYKVNQKFENSIGSKIRKSKVASGLIKPLSKGSKLVVQKVKSLEKGTKHKIQDAVNLFKETPDFEFKKRGENFNPITRAIKKQYVQSPNDQIYRFKLSDNKSVEVKGEKKAENFNKMVQKNQYRKAFKNIDNIDIKQAETTVIDKKLIDDQFKQQNTSFKEVQKFQLQKRRTVIQKTAKAVAQSKPNIQKPNFENIKKT